MKISPMTKAHELADQRAKSGLPLTADQYAKLMRSAAIATEAQERKRQELEAEKRAEKETQRRYARP
jgi:hypothetical protein